MREDAWFRNDLMLYRLDALVIKTFGYIDRSFRHI
jgi:hypothetical protein